MTYPHGGAAQIWRDGAGVAHNPAKSEIRDWAAAVERSVSYLPAGLDVSGATNMTSILQPLIGSVEEIALPAGTFYASLDVTSPLTISGAGEGRTILTTEMEANGTTITVNADLYLRDLTVKGHPTSAGSKTIENTGAHTVRTDHVTFDGTNHDPATSLTSVGKFRHSTFLSSASPNALGARCWSPLAEFTDCHFQGGRTIEPRDSKFRRCTVRAEDSAVHIPDGEYGNDGVPDGYSGVSEWYDCDIQSDGSGMTCGNAGHPKLRGTTIIAGRVETGKQAFYARSASTVDAEDCNFIAQNSGTAVSFSDLEGPGSIARAGESVMKRCRLEGDFNSLAVPATTDTYPAAIGNVLLVDCDIIGGDDEISPKTSNYHILSTEKFSDWADSVTYTADNTTQRFRFKADGMKVSVLGSDAAKTGCHLSHLDAVTGEPHPDGMKIQLRYGGVSSRFITFANGATDDGGAMYFADDASTLTTGQQKSYLFILDSTTWRQIDG